MQLWCQNIADITPGCSPEQRLFQVAKKVLKSPENLLSDGTEHALSAFGVN